MMTAVISPDRIFSTSKIDVFAKSQNSMAK